MASTSGTKPLVGTYGDADEDLAALFALQHDELAAAKTAYSDHEFAYQLQMSEALTASILLSPHPSEVASSSSGVAASSVPLNDDFAAASSVPVNDDFAAAVELFSEEMDRLEREQANLQQYKAEMRQMRRDFDLQLHDKKFASEIYAIPEQEWLASGGYYQKPYSEIGGPDLGFSEDFSLCFKGLVVQDQNTVKLGAIGVAVFDSMNAVVLEVSKPLVLPEAEMRDEVAQLEAFVHGLELCLSLELRRVVYFCADFNVDYYLNGAQTPKEAKVAELVNEAVLLKKRFLNCHASIGNRNNAQLVLESARSSIAKQAGKLIKESCLICLEEVDSRQVFEIGSCHHRFCSSCMQKYIKSKVSSREPPRCPQPNCGSDLNFTVCRKFLNPEMYETLDQLIKESSIPVTQKVYCPSPRCSNLMSKADAIANYKHNVTGVSRVELTGGRCLKCHMLLCVSCRGPWHSNMTCAEFKNKQNLSSEDAKLKQVAVAKKWRQCPRCNHMVELAEGCNHIYCRCGHEFCYLCGYEWKNKRPTCSCVLWLEENIIRH